MTASEKLRLRNSGLHDGNVTARSSRALLTSWRTPYGDRMNKKGFTLIELLIVIVIIGILAAIAIPKFANTKSKAYVTAMKSDLRNLVSAEESLFSDSARYTSNLTSLGFKASTGVAAPAIVTYPGAWVATNSH